MKILDTIEGFPYSNKYIIQLKQTFKNVIYVELLSTEFPYIDYIIKNNTNNKFYWQNIDDGDYLYSVSLNEGSYNLDKLITNLHTQINLTPRNISTITNPVNNIFDIKYDNITNKIIFNSYNNILLPNSLNVLIVNINNIDYYQLQIKQDNHTVSVGDIISIQNALQVSIINQNIIQGYIPSSYINNQQFTVYSIDSNSNKYNMLLGKTTNINTITDLLKINNYSYGGNDIIIKQNTKFRLLFNKNDTFGDILGFKDVGSVFAITPFNKQISNFDQYIINNNLNSIGDLITTNNLINLSGKNTYFLMYLNNIEFINNINLPTAFAKILLSGNQGDYLFNTFVKQSSDTYSPSFPIHEITNLNISFLFSDGSIPDFRNINHSFTLKIVEEIIQSNDIQRNSNHTNYINEMKRLH
jgi:hypothetical protein